MICKLEQGGKLWTKEGEMPGRCYPAGSLPEPERQKICIWDFCNRKSRLQPRRQPHSITFVKMCLFLRKAERLTKNSVLYSFSEKKKKYGKRMSWWTGNRKTGELSHTRDVLLQENPDQGDKAGKHVGLTSTLTSPRNKTPINVTHLEQILTITQTWLIMREIAHGWSHLSVTRMEDGSAPGHPG